MTDCKLCKKAIVEEEEFVVVGTYPKSGYIYYRSMGRVPLKHGGKSIIRPVFLKYARKRMRKRRNKHG